MSPFRFNPFEDEIDSDSFAPTYSRDVQRPPNIQKDPASFILDSLETPWQPFHLCMPCERHHTAPSPRQLSYGNTLQPLPFLSPVLPPAHPSLPQFAREMGCVFDTPDSAHPRCVPPPIPYHTYYPVFPRFTRGTKWILDVPDIPYPRHVLVPVPYPCFPVHYHALEGEWISHVPHVPEPRRTPPWPPMPHSTYPSALQSQYAPEVACPPQSQYASEVACPLQPQYASKVACPPQPEYSPPIPRHHEQNRHPPISHIFAYDSKAGTLVTSRIKILAPKPIRPIQHAQMELEVTATWLTPAIMDNFDPCGQAQAPSPAVDDAGSKAPGVLTCDHSATVELADARKVSPESEVTATVNPASQIAFMDTEAREEGEILQMSESPVGVLLDVGKPISPIINFELPSGSLGCEDLCEDSTAGFWE